MNCPTYIDIDGTLTDCPDEPGSVNAKRVVRVKEMIEKNIPVVIWSARGTQYARTFCEMNGIRPLAAIGKPKFCIDDKSTITRAGLLVLTPETLDI